MIDPSSSIPVIDIGAFFAGSERERDAVARRIDDNNRDTGFLLVSGHGVPRERIDAMFAVSRALFEGPQSVRDAVAAPRGEHHGFHGLRGSGLAAKEGGTAPPDLREYFMVGRLDLDHPSFDTPAGRSFHRPNRWPDAPAFVAEAQRYYRTMESLGAMLLRLFARALAVDERWFESRIDHHFSILSSIWYPPQPVPPEPGQLRAGAHTDYGALTILAPSDAPGGLQVMSLAGEWIDVPYRPDAYVINIGDMLQRWTDGRWRSTPHRVVNPPRAASATGARQSLAYFLHPNHDAVIDAIPGCVPPGAAARHPPILAGDYMRSREANIEGAGAPA